MRPIPFLFILLISPSLPAQSPLDSLENYIEQQIYSPFEEGLAGMGVSIFSSDTLYLARGYGYADQASQKPYTAQTVQNIASISKTFIGVSLMIAEQEGLLTLDDPINQHLPFKVKHPRFPDTEITLRHLATHTSGIKDRTLKYGLKSYTQDKSPSMSLGDYLTACVGEGGKWNPKKSYTSHKPGTHYHYSNVGAALAAYAIECAAGVPFSRYTQEKVLAPLGMDDSGWSYSAIDESMHATLYKKNGKVKKPYTLVTYPDGGMRTSVLSLTKHFQAIMLALKGKKSPTLSPEQAQSLIRPHFPESFPITNDVGSYNSGIFIEIEGPKVVGHTGGDPGVATIAFFDPEADIGRIFFFNRRIPNEMGSHMGEWIRAIDGFVNRSR